MSVNCEVINDVKCKEKYGRASLQGLVFWRYMQGNLRLFFCETRLTLKNIASGCRCPQAHFRATWISKEHGWPELVSGNLSTGFHGVRLGSSSKYLVVYVSLRPSLTEFDVYCCLFLYSVQKQMPFTMASRVINFPSFSRNQKYRFIDYEHTKSSSSNVCLLNYCKRHFAHQKYGKF